MPFTIKPFEQASTITPSGSTLDPVFRQLATFDYQPDRAWLQASGNKVRGTIAGGPSYDRFMDFGSEQKYLPIAPRPALTAPVLPDTAAFYRRQLGAIDFNAIDPYSTLDQGADQAKQAIPGDPFAAVRGLQDFLASKNIDIFGTGSTGAPARAADYALAFPLAVLERLTGTSGLVASVSGLLPRGGSPRPEDDPYFKLHNDPRYWQAISTFDAGQLDVLARDYASQFVDTAVNSYAVEQLRSQFERDKAMALGLSSGSDAIDYRAIKTASRGIFGSRVGGLQNIPLVGTQIVQLLDPVSPEEQAQWASLPVKQRQAMLSQAGFVQTVADIVGSLPAFGAMGTVLEVARAGTGMGKLLATGYDALLRGSTVVASAGLTAALGNWALSAASPEWAAGIGREVDLARPISGSFLAAEVNQIGYFSTGTWGAWGVGKIGSRILSKALSGAAGHVIQGIGLPETALYQFHLGGAPMSDLAASTGIPVSALRLSAERLHTSYAIHLARKPLEDMYEAIASGAKILARPELDELSVSERLAVASDELMTGLQGAPGQARVMFDILNAAHKPEAIVLSEQARQISRWIKAQARTIDENMGQAFIRDYGVEWASRQAGGYTEAALKGAVKGRLDRLGYDFSAIEGEIHGEDSWAQMLRVVHQYEFDAKNGELAASFDVPGAPPTREAGKLALVEANHLFLDKAERLAETIKTGSNDEVRAAVREFVATIEGERWYSRNFRPRGFGRAVIKSVASIEPGSVAKWIEETRPALLQRRLLPAADAATADLPLNAFHRGLVDDGLWDLAFKPVNDAGELVSYVHTNDGHVFQTPWLDYPMSNIDNIELGNRGYIMTKYDAIFRAFRTYRVAEFQRGLLFRNLTGGKYGLSVTGSQIEAFNRDVMKYAAEVNVQAQTLGAVGHGAVGIGTAYKDKLSAIAEMHFGGGPEIKAIDWSKVVADSYRQSLKLNFTAGLTSYMKAHFGPIGTAAALWSDIGYINFRFGLSPLFKLGEVEETIQLNGMAGVNPHPDPWTEALFYRQGIGENHGIMTQEQTYDQLLLGAGKQAPAERQAVAYGFLSLRAPETLAQKQARAMLQVEAERVAAFNKPEAEIQAAYDAGEIAKGQALNRDLGIARGGTAESGGAMRANAPKVDLGLNVPPPEHLVNAELATLVDDAGNVLKGNEDRVIELNQVLADYEAARQFVADVAAKPLATGRDGLLADLRQTLRDDGQTIVPGLETRHDEIANALLALDAPTHPPVVDNLTDLPGTPEFLISNINELDPAILAPLPGEAAQFARQLRQAPSKAVKLVRNPIPFKQHQALLYRIEKLRREFPTLIRASGVTGFEDVMHQLGVPERDWITFLMTDRELAQAYSSSGHPDDLAALLAHGGDSQAVRGAFDDLYASEDWATITSLWSIADRTAADDAFRVHFFNPYRSWLERSLNHPLVGIYPLSWALKAAREWMKFLYDNHTIAGLRLGMTPAVAINHIVRAQAATFAQTNDTTLEKYVGLNGPFGSSFLIFNLILPGDWSSIPFPASRTVRDLLRKGPEGMALGMPDQVGRIGLGRDARLLVESAGEVKDWLFPSLAKGAAAPLPWEPFTGNQSVTLDAQGTNR